jgi:Flp pilus assembly protein TadG
MQRITDLLSRFRKDERGVFLVVFAVLAIVLIATSGAVVDFTMTQQARTRAQTALDSATLALQSQIGSQTADQLKAKAQTILTERLNDASITAEVTSVTPNLVTGKLNIQAYIQVPTAFVQLVGINSIRSNLQSEVTRASSDLEVSLALDVTQSMAGTKIEALKASTNSLIDQVVQDEQEPTYSKMAIAPYSMAVNLGGFADEARGDVVTGKAITSATWAHATVKNIAISSITKSPDNTTATVIKFSAAQSFVLGDYIWISATSGVGDTTWNLLGVYRVGTVAADKKSFSLMKSDNTKHNSKSYSGTYSSGGRVTKCLNAMCELTVTSTAHGIANNHYAYITGGSGYATSGTYKFTSKTWKVEGVAANSYIVDATDPRMITNSSYSGTGGTSYCTDYGCDYYYYQSKGGQWNLYRPTECAVERPTTSHAADDTNPTDAPVGFYYNSNGSDCLGREILPLTSDKEDLHYLANHLSVAGSTAGQIGLAWAWYMISPNFVTEDLADVWPADATPAAYAEDNLVKAVILMTDGVFNTMYEHGVPSRDSSTLSGNDNVRSAVNSPLGDSIAQAEALCDAIKAVDENDDDKGDVLLYTVGFDIGGNTQEEIDARDFLSGCATPGGYYYLANDADDLQDAFNSIASSLSELRLSK